MAKFITANCDRCGTRFSGWRNTYLSIKHYCSRSCANSAVNADPVVKAKLSLSRLGNKYARKHGRYFGAKGYVILSDGGRMQEHRRVMEKSIGRNLLKREVVHHWDENKTNNKRENLALFRTTGAHTRLHNFARNHKIPVIKLKFEQLWLN